MSRDIGSKVKGKVVFSGYENIPCPTGRTGFVRVEAAHMDWISGAIIKVHAGGDAMDESLVDSVSIMLSNSEVYIQRECFRLLDYWVAEVREAHAETMVDCIVDTYRYNQQYFPRYLDNDAQIEEECEHLRGILAQPDSRGITRNVSSISGLNWDNLFLEYRVMAVNIPLRIPTDHPDYVALQDKGKRLS